MTQWCCDDCHVSKRVFGLAAEGEELGVGKSLQQGDQHGAAGFAFCGLRCPVGVRVPSLMGVPGVGVPQDGLVGDAEGMERTPDDGGGRFAPRALASREAPFLEVYARDEPLQHQTLTSEWDVADLAALIPWRLANQDPAGVAVQVRAQAREALGWCVCVGVGGWIEIGPW